MNAPPKKWTVAVLEGTHDDDIAVYFCREEPVLVFKTPEGRENDPTIFVQFIPRNGSPFRVNRPTLVPLIRLIAIAEDVPDAD